MALIVHIADLHIGSGIDRTARKDEYEQVFLRFAQNMNELKKSGKDFVIVIAGDIFHHKKNYEPVELYLFNFLMKILKNHLIIIIPGNHDMNINANINTTAENNEGVDLINPFTELHDNVIYLRETTDRVVRINGEELVFKHISVSDITSTAQSILATMKGTEIILYHGSIDGTILFDGCVPLTGRRITAEIIDKARAVILGDTHQQQFILGRTNAAYCGSLIKQDVSESDSKGYMIWTLNKETNKYTGEFIVIPNEAVMMDFDFRGKTVDEAKAQLNTYQRINPKRIIKINVATSDSRENVHELEKYIAEKFQFRPRVHNYTKAIGGALINVDDSIRKRLALANLGQEAIENFMKMCGNRGQVAKRWHVLRMEWDNLMTFGKENIIDFTKTSSLMGIFADNGWGKSSVIDIMHYGLFGKYIRGDKSIVRYGEKNGGVQIIFAVNDKKYGIERCFGTSRFALKLYEVADDNTRTIISIEKNDILIHINKLIGTKEEFCITAAMYQSDEDISKLFNAEGITLLSSAFGLTDVKEMDDLAKKNIASTEAYIKSFFDWKQDSVESYTICLETNQTKLVKFKETREEIIHNIKSCEQEIDEITSAIKQFDISKLNQEIIIVESEIIKLKEQTQITIILPECGNFISDINEYKKLLDILQRSLIAEPAELIEVNFNYSADAVDNATRIVKAGEPTFTKTLKEYPCAYYNKTHEESKLFHSNGWLKTYKPIEIGRPDAIDEVNNPNIENIEMYVSALESEKPDDPGLMDGPAPIKISDIELRQLKTIVSCGPPNIPVPSMVIVPDNYIDSSIDNSRSALVIINEKIARSQSIIQKKPTSMESEVSMIDELKQYEIELSSIQFVDIPNDIELNTLKQDIENQKLKFESKCECCKYNKQKLAIESTDVSIVLARIDEITSSISRATEANKQSSLSRDVLINKISFAKDNLIKIKSNNKLYADACAAEEDIVLQTFDQQRYMKLIVDFEKFHLVYENNIIIQTKQKEYNRYEDARIIVSKHDECIKYMEYCKKKLAFDTYNRAEEMVKKYSKYCNYLEYKTKLNEYEDILKKNKLHAKYTQYRAAKHYSEYKIILAEYEKFQDDKIVFTEASKVLSELELHKTYMVLKNAREDVIKKNKRITKARESIKQHNLSVAYNKASACQLEHATANINLTNQRQLLATLKDNLNQAIANNQKSTRLKELKGLKPTLSEQLLDITKQIAVVESNIQNLEAEFIKHEKYDQNTRESKLKNAEFKTIHKLCQSGGIKDAIVKDNLPPIIEEMNAIITSTGANFKIVDHVVEPPAGNPYIIALHIAEIKNGINTLNPIVMASSYQKFLTSVAFRLSLSRNLRISSNFICIDEGFGKADKHNLISIQQMLESIKCNYEFIFIISHLTEMCDIIKNDLRHKLIISCNPDGTKMVCNTLDKAQKIQPRPGICETCNIPYGAFQGIHDNSDEHIRRLIEVKKQNAEINFIAAEGPADAIPPAATKKNGKERAPCDEKPLLNINFILNSEGHQKCLICDKIIKTKSKFGDHLSSVYCMTARAKRAILPKT